LEDGQQEKAELYADEQAVQEWKRVDLEERGEALEVVVFTFRGQQQLQLLYVRHINVHALIVT